MFCFESALLSSTSIEIGFKSTLENGRYQVNGAIFYQAFDGDVARWSYIMTYQGGPQSKVRADILTPIKLMQKLLEEGVAKNELSVNDIPLMAQILVGIIEHPALGLIYEEIKGPLANSEKEVVAAIEKILRA